MKRLVQYLGSPGSAVGFVHDALLHGVASTAIPEEPKLDADGRRVVEPKDKTKDRIKRSPDDLDGMKLAYAAPPEKKAKAVKLGLWKR